MLTLQSTALVALLLQTAAYAATPGDDGSSFYADDWTTGACPNGTNLSPINVLETTAVVAPEGWDTQVDFPVVTGMKDKNTGTSMQLEWAPIGQNATSTTVAARGKSISDIFLSEGALTRMKLTPLQMHWHTPSEHAVNGVFYAAEGHIVSAIAEGEAPAEWGCDKFWETGDAADLVLDKCIAVFGVLYKLGEDTTPPLLSELIANEPLTAATETPIPGSIDLDEFLPGRKDYYTYRGSLTTPDCNEGLRWHVFSEAMTISPADQKAMEKKLADTHPEGQPEATSDYRANRQYIQDLNGRVVYRVGNGTSDMTSFTVNLVLSPNQQVIDASQASSG